MGCMNSTPKKSEVQEKRQQASQVFKEIEAAAVVEVNLESVKHNIKELKKHCEPIMLTLSSDAFCHGALQVAKLAVTQKVDTFAVSSLKEGIELREGGITPEFGRIIVFGEPSQVELPGYSAFGLGALITCKRSADSIREWSKLYHGKKKLFAYILVDAGYTGIGIPSSQVSQCVMSLMKAKNKNISFQGLVVKTADDQIHAERPSVNLEEVADVVEALLNKDVKINRMIFDNNPTLLGEWDRLAREFGSQFLDDTTCLARCSLETFGFVHEDLEIPKLRQCLSLKGQVRDIRKVKHGEYIGYGPGFQAVFDCFVAVVSCGYSQGYPHVKSENKNQPKARCNNRSYTVIGDVCSDHLLVLLGPTDVTPQVNVGDYMTLFGASTDDAGNQTLLEICELAGVSPSQTLCHLSSAVAKRHKSTKALKRKTNMKMQPKDPKELLKEAKKTQETDAANAKNSKKKKDGKAKKGSKKKEEKRSKRPSTSKSKKSSNRKRSEDIHDKQRYSVEVTSKNSSV